MKTIKLVLWSLKSVASLVGASITAATAAADLPVGWTIAAAVAAAVATWAIPNIESVEALDVLALVEKTQAEQQAGTTLTVPDSPKSLRETLCLAQSAVAHRGTDAGRRDRDVAVLGRLIDECDRHRPLGPDGKHDDRHTPTCGCEEA